MPTIITLSNNIIIFFTRLQHKVRRVPLVANDLFCKLCSANKLLNACFLDGETLMNFIACIIILLYAINYVLKLN